MSDPQDFASHAPAILDALNRTIALGEDARRLRDALTGRRRGGEVRLAEIGGQIGGYVPSGTLPLDEEHIVEPGHVYRNWGTP